MKELLNPVQWLPYICVLLQTYLFLAMAIFFLKRTKVIRLPVAGLDYSNVVIAGSVLLGVLFISTASAASIFQASRILVYDNNHILRNSFLKFAEYFIAGIFWVGIFLIAGFVNQRLFFTLTGKSEIQENNLPHGLLIASMNTGIAIVIWFLLKEFAERITPAFANFR